MRCPCLCPPTRAGAVQVDWKAKGPQDRLHSGCNLCGLPWRRLGANCNRKGHVATRGAVGTAGLRARTRTARSSAVCCRRACSLPCRARARALPCTRACPPPSQPCTTHHAQQRKTGATTLEIQEVNTDTTIVVRSKLQHCATRGGGLASRWQRDSAPFLSVCPYAPSCVRGKE